jgi:transketolase
MDIRDLQKKADQIRVDTLRTLHGSGVGYVGSAMSAVEIMTALYYGQFPRRKIVNLDVRMPGWEGRDYVVMSKSHCAPLQYSILADLGFFSKEELQYFSRPGSMLQAKPSLKVPGMSATAGTHGHGLSVALGIAMSLKMDRKDNKVYAILGDGELQTGQIWEAATAAAHYKLNNLIVLIDHNKLQRSGPVNAVMDIASIRAKFDAFGWNVSQVLDGHNFNDLIDGIERGFTSVRRPVCIICHTVSGKGLCFAEGKPGYHAAELSEPEMTEIISQLTKSS